jgi:hypothetical protein
MQKQFTIDDLVRISELFSEAKTFTIQVTKDTTRPLTKAEIFVRLQAGQEVGIGPYASCDGISSVSGKLTFSANVQAALVKASGRYNYTVNEHTDTLCRLTFFEKDEREKSGWRAIGVSDFSMKDAQNAGLTNRGFMWKNYPRNMLFARALTNGVSWHCPDVTGGLRAYTAEELGQDNEEEAGNIQTPEPHDLTVASSEPFGTPAVAGAGVIPHNGAVREAYSVKKVAQGYEVECRNLDGKGVWTHTITQGIPDSGCSCGKITRKGEEAACVHAQEARKWAVAQADAKRKQSPVEDEALQENLATLAKWRPNIEGNIPWAITDPIKQTSLWNHWEQALLGGADVNQLFDVTGGTALPDLKEDEFASVDMALKAIAKNPKGVKK